MSSSTIPISVMLQEFTQRIVIPVYKYNMAKLESQEVIKIRQAIDIFLNKSEAALKEDMRTSYEEAKKKKLEELEHEKVS